MHNRFRLFSVSCALAAATVLAACSSPPKPIYQQEQFDATSSPYAHTFHSKSDAACEAARRALLSQGYVVSSSRNDAVDGSKNFQPSNDMHVVIEFHVVCADANADGSSSIAYVNAVQDRYTLKKSNTSASVGLSVFGSLSLPIGSSDDALVKTASETIPAGVFYERFFNLVEHFLKIDPARRDRATVKAAEKEPVAPLPEPAPTPQGEPMKMTTPVVPTPPAAPVPLSVPGVTPGSGANAVPA
ncbi:PF10001 family protein, partial [Burkholderia cenocepacia BC7]